MFIVFLSQPEDSVGQTKPQQASCKQCNLVPVPLPVSFVALETQKLVTIRKTVECAIPWDDLEKTVEKSKQTKDQVL